MRKKKTFILVIIFLISGITHSQERIPRDSLILDFDFLVKYLEETHPDPYSAFGGKVFFHKLVFDIKNNISEEGCTKEEFSFKISSFLSKLGDGHTYIQSFKSSGNKIKDYILPLELQAATDGLYISGLSQENKNFIGSRLISINNTPIDTLLDLAGEIFPTENIYGKYRAFRMHMTSYNYLKILVPKIEKELTLQVERQDKSINKFTIAFLPDSLFQKCKMVYRPNWDKLSSKKYMYYQYLDDNKQTMFFHFENVMAREAFIMMKKWGMNDIKTSMDWFYKNSLNEKRPEDEDEAIAKMPSLLETFQNMLLEMRKNNSKNLIIDLRDNGGGYTPITLPTLYQLFGDRYLDVNMQTAYYQLISPLYLQKMNLTLEQYNKQHNSNYKFGDYLFPINSSEKVSIEKKRAKFLTRNNFAKDYISDLNGKALYTPEKIIVLTNDQTISAGFHYAFYLWKLGATVVGVPSAQAPNTFMENTAFELPYTKLKGSISNSFQLFLPPNDRRAKVFYPDIVLNWDNYKAYNFDKQTEILFTLDLLSKYL